MEKYSITFEKYYKIVTTFRNKIFSIRISSYTQYIFQDHKPDCSCYLSTNKPSAAIKNKTLKNTKSQNRVRKTTKKHDSLSTALQERKSPFFRLAELSISFFCPPKKSADEWKLPRSTRTLRRHVLHWQSAPSRHAGKYYTCIIRALGTCSVRATARFSKSSPIRKILSSSPSLAKRSLF